MRKALLMVVAFAFVVSTAALVYAGDLPKPVEKFTKGAVDVAKSPLAIYDHTKAGYDGSDIKVLGLFKGLIESPFHVVKKAGSGAIDMATFPVE
ncbi:MAG TPA: hypothetical protein VI749_00175 [Candidatus Omnitrophota bacterium]|nr:hypothetical protein [Candidatus Omnitrophota bacterium]